MHIDGQEQDGCYCFYWAKFKRLETFTRIKDIPTEQMFSKYGWNKILHVFQKCNETGVRMMLTHVKCLYQNHLFCIEVV